MTPTARIAVMGAGAVGCYFGGMLARSGVPVTLIGRLEHMKAIERDGLWFDSNHYRGSIRLQTSTDPAAVAGADFILLCVKTRQTVSAMHSAIRHLSKGATVVCLQNGVDNVERLRVHEGIEAMPAVVWVAVEMNAPGVLKHNGRGDLVLPPVPEAARLAALFERAAVPCKLSDNFQAALWTKMIINCTYNAISALGRSTYGSMLSNPTTAALMRLVMEESAGVARALGVNLDTVQLWDTTANLGESMKRAMSSTAQDLALARFTEIDSLNGYIVERAAQLGMGAPLNLALHALVKQIEFTLHPIIP